MKTTKTIVAIAISLLSINTFSQSADSASVTASDIANLTGQQTAPVWVDPGLSQTSAGQVTGAINANNALINQQLTALQNQINSLKASGGSGGAVGTGGFCGSYHSGNWYVQMPGLIRDKSCPGEYVSGKSGGYDLYSCPTGRSFFQYNTVDIAGGRGGGSYTQRHYTCM